MKKKKIFKQIAAFAGIAMILATLLVFPAHATDTATNNTQSWSIKEPATVPPGLYETGTSKIIRTWDQLINSNYIKVENQEIKTNYRGDGINDSKEKLTGDLYIPKIDGIIAISGFEFCENLTLIYIPEGITELSRLSFAYTTKLQTLYIPKSVQRIGSYTISNSGVKRIIYSGTTEDWAKIEIEEWNQPFQKVKIKMKTDVKPIMQEITSTITGGISQISIGIGQGLTNLTKNIFLTETSNGTNTLSTFGGTIIIFAGLALAIGISKYVTKWITSLGK